MKPLGEFLSALKEQLAKVRGGAYDVRRGAINWANFSFKKKTRAAAVMCDECAVFQRNDGTPAKVTVEMFAKRTDYDEEQGIDDPSMDEMREDVRVALERMISLKDRLHDSVVMQLDTNTATAVETHDAKLQVQGLIVTFSVRV